ncbi:hypothetical protein EVAR_29386_1 [Eumeta japonica]|uniref:Uncharacterized protein n=1 Tax=Eumeta variegata TaxID=151549 RepID=A0A4C1YDR7_EUMVA|nr:hypothetical protein EVAR_29386_1 [Eumeta japonica]
MDLSYLISGEREKKYVANTVVASVDCGTERHQRRSSMHERNVGKLPTDNRCTYDGITAGKASGLQQHKKAHSHPPSRHKINIFCASAVGDYVHLFCGRGAASWAANGRCQPRDDEAGRPTYSPRHKASSRLDFYRVGTSRRVGIDIETDIKIALRVDLFEDRKWVQELDRDSVQFRDTTDMSCWAAKDVFSSLVRNEISRDKYLKKILNYCIKYKSPNRRGIPSHSPYLLKSEESLALAPLHRSIVHRGPLTTIGPARRRRRRRRLKVTRIESGTFQFEGDIFKDQTTAAGATQKRNNYCTTTYVIISFRGNIFHCGYDAPVHLIVLTTCYNSGTVVLLQQLPLFYHDDGLLSSLQQSAFTLNGADAVRRPRHTIRRRKTLTHSRRASERHGNLPAPAMLSYTITPSFVRVIADVNSIKSELRRGLDPANCADIKPFCALTAPARRAPPRRAPPRPAAPLSHDEFSRAVSEGGRRWAGGALSLVNAPRLETFEDRNTLLKGMHEWDTGARNVSEDWEKYGGYQLEDRWGK